MSFTAIHMAFDCIAIAMGLFASVAATWMPNEQYTYGYVFDTRKIVKFSCPFLAMVVLRRSRVLRMGSFCS